MTFCAPRSVPLARLLATALAAGLLGLTGCGKHDDDRATAATPRADAGASAHTNAAAEAENAKFNGYVQSYNRLADRYGLAYHADLSLRHKLDRLDPNSTLIFSYNLDDGLKSLRDARAVESTAYPQLDRIADALVRDLQTLSELHKQHENYYATKAYRDDKFALAKQLDPQIRGAYTDALAQFEQLDTALNAAEQTRSERDLAALKALPNPLPYDTKHVLVLAKRLVDATAVAGAADEAGAFAKPDGVKSALYEAIQVLDQEIQKQKTPQDGLSGHGMVLFNARQLLSDYSDLRSDGDARKFESMVSNYNQMVSQANQI